MSVQRVTRPVPWTGHVVGCESGVARVQTDQGEVRATYSGQMLDRVARDRGCAARVGDVVVLRYWTDGKVTIEEALRPAERYAEVIELHRS